MKSFETPTTNSTDEMRERLLAGVAMMELGIEIMRNNIKRQLGSSVTDDEVSKALKIWLFEAPTNSGLRPVRNE